jgi:hypothetical protein
MFGYQKRAYLWRNPMESPIIVHDPFASMLLGYQTHQAWLIQLLNNCRSRLIRWFGSDCPF